MGGLGVGIGGLRVLGFEALLWSLQELAACFGQAARSATGTSQDFRLWGLRFGILGLGYRVLGLGFWGFRLTLRFYRDVKSCKHKADCEDTVSMVILLNNRTNVLCSGAPREAFTSRILLPQYLQESTAEPSECYTI